MRIHYFYPLIFFMSFYSNTASAMDMDPVADPRRSSYIFSNGVTPDDAYRNLGKTMKTSGQGYVYYTAGDEGVAQGSATFVDINKMNAWDMPPSFNFKDQIWSGYHQRLILTAAHNFAPLFWLYTEQQIQDAMQVHPDFTVFDLRKLPTQTPIRFGNSDKFALNTSDPAIRFIIVNNLYANFTENFKSKGWESVKYDAAFCVLQEEQPHLMGIPMLHHSTSTINGIYGGFVGYSTGEAKGAWLIDIKDDSLAEFAAESINDHALLTSVFLNPTDDFVLDENEMTPQMWDRLESAQKKHRQLQQMSNKQSAIPYSAGNSGDSGAGVVIMLKNQNYYLVGIMGGLMQKQKRVGSTENISMLDLKEEFAQKPLKDWYGKLYTAIAPIVDVGLGCVSLKTWICKMLIQPLD